MKWNDIIGPMLASGIVENERQLSLLAGGTESLVSTSKARDRDISMDAAIHLLVEMEDRKQEWDTAVMTGDRAVSPQRKEIARNAFWLFHYLWEDVRRQCRASKAEGGAE